MNSDIILIILAIVCFLLDAFNAPIKIKLTPIGLALWALSLIT